MQAKIESGHSEDNAVQIPVGINPEIRLLICDIDNTLAYLRQGKDDGPAHLRQNRYASILNHDLIIPLLRWASLIMPLGIDTARDRRLDNDIGSSGGASITDLRKFFERFNIHFNDNFIIASEDVTEFRDTLKSQYNKLDAEEKPRFIQFIKEKNADLHFIMKLYNESGIGKPIKPEEILILDDSEGVIVWAQKAGFKALHVKHDFNGIGTLDVEYAYELARILGLESYIKDVEEHPEAHSNDPVIFSSTAQEYMAAKKARKENKPVVRLPVHPLLDDMLMHFIKDPREVLLLLKQLHGRDSFSQVIDEEYDFAVDTQEGQSASVRQTLLGYSTQENAFYRVKSLLALGAYPNQPFDLCLYEGQVESPGRGLAKPRVFRQIKPLTAAVILGDDFDILEALVNHNAQIDFMCDDNSVLQIALEKFRGKLLGRKCSQLEQQSLYKQIRLIVASMQKQHGLDTYFKHLYIAFPVIMQMEDANVLAIFLNNLNAGQRSILYSSIDLSGRKDNDFYQQLMIEFFLDHPLKSIKKTIPSRHSGEIQAVIAGESSAFSDSDYGAAKGVLEFLTRRNATSPGQPKTSGSKVIPAGIFRLSSELFADEKLLKRHFFSHFLQSCLRTSLSGMRVRSLLNIFLSILENTESAAEKRKGDEWDVNVHYLSQENQLSSCLLGCAIQSNNPWFTNRLLKAGVKPNHYFDLDPDYRQVPPLNAAIIGQCDTQIVQDLIKAGAEIKVWVRKSSQAEKESILNLIITRICNHANYSRRKELLEQLQAVIRVIITQQGVDAYFDALLPARALIMKSKDSRLMTTCFGLLPRNFKESLWYGFASDNLYPEHSIEPTDFKLKYDMEFFFQMKDEELPLLNGRFKRVLSFIQPERNLLHPWRLRLQAAFPNVEEPVTMEKTPESRSLAWLVESQEKDDPKPLLKRLEQFSLYINRLAETVIIDSNQIKSLMLSCYFAVQELLNSSIFNRHFSQQLKPIEELYDFLKKSLQGSLTAEYQSKKQSAISLSHYRSSRSALFGAAPVTEVTPDSSGVGLSSSR
ncbi:hypothetical protein Lbir_2447 [Legionella birminghamensis]|uniref:Uncharacterized protein n=1 Tax=Legionella birminghamensis TaxID=28083 RepID=A0A378I9L1_9GAMM|nr:hypothetical protein [Legionella birminghamensis]KTC68914.1 hypothetical protein Lbir_2447 [Legionella birminghamensis]STX31430.1 Uncharacterised protein [Legionella birminghamensis]